MSITFVTLAIPPYWEQETTLMVKSLRSFGGEMAEAELLTLILKDKPLSLETVAQLQEYGAEIAEFTMDEEAADFPLAVVPFGAAAAEKAITTDLMAWLLPDTLILNSPLEFILPTEKQLGFRPVHHRNIGSRYERPLNAYWQLIYKHCTVPKENVFEMETCYREPIRPYFNAGLLVSRPAEGLMQTWQENFLRTYQHPDFTPFYTQRKYAIFMHQAILSGVVLSRYPQEQLTELPETYNYPLHMHQDYPAVGRIEQLDELTTARFEDTKSLSQSLTQFETVDKKHEWLNTQIANDKGMPHD